jgi:predicted kinase
MAGCGSRRRGRRGEGSLAIACNPTTAIIVEEEIPRRSTVSLSIQNFAGLVRPATLDAVREAFTLAMQQMGLEVVKDGTFWRHRARHRHRDIKRDSTYAYVATIEPFIELEVRLRDTAKGENLILLRNQAHSTASDEAAFRYADVLVKFLR